MTVRRIDAGPVLAALGAMLLLVSLFLEWYEEGLTAWEAFELVDVLLAALAIGAILAVLGRAGIGEIGLDPRWLPWAAGAAFVLVVVAILDPPPVAADRDIDVGLWLALAGAAVLALGAVLAVTRITFSMNVESRRRIQAVDARQPTAAPPPPPSAAPPGAAPAGDADPTRPLPS